ncbi:MAG: hypothetical protein Q9205_003124 [Flavoplaca limonia]
MTRSSHATYAPEVINDVAPEVAPGRGIQVFYDSTPPEALIIKPEETATRPYSIIATPTPQRRNKNLLLIIALVILAIALGLGLGLGLGLRQRENQDTKASTTVSADSSITNTPIPRVKRHGLMTNTSFTALAFRDGQRFVYFQEATGALRRATFDPTDEVWDHTLFYVNQDNNIDCIEFSVSEPFNGGCSIRENSVDFPSNAVSGETTQVSATMLMPTGVSPGLLLAYQEPSGKISVILGYQQGAQKKLWSWVNVTDQFDSLLSTSGSKEISEGRMAAACNAGWASGDPSSDILYLICFLTIEGDLASSETDFLMSFRILVNGTLPGNFTVDIGESVRLNFQFTADES